MSNLDIQEANANSLANAKISANSTIRPLYIITVEDPSSKVKNRHFAVLKGLQETAGSVGGIGFFIEQNKTQNEKVELNNMQEAINLADTGTVEIIEIKFPWHKVISIKNHSFKYNKSVK